MRYHRCKVIVQRRPERPYLPGKDPRCLRQDDRVLVDRSITVDHAVYETSLKLLRSIEYELRQVLVARAIPAHGLE
jgi:hypothetical protein